MYLEKIVAAEDKKGYLNTLNDSEKQTLIKEIQEKKKSSEDEYIRLETMKNLSELGISSYNDLDAEINKLESELDEEIIKFAGVLGNE